MEGGDWGWENSPLWCEVREVHKKNISMFTLAHTLMNSCGINTTTTQKWCDGGRRTIKKQGFLVRHHCTCFFEECWGRTLTPHPSPGLCLNLASHRETQKSDFFLKKTCHPLATSDHVQQRLLACVQIQSCFAEEKAVSLKKGQKLRLLHANRLLLLLTYSVSHHRQPRALSRLR